MRRRVFTVAGGLIIVGLIVFYAVNHAPERHKIKSTLLKETSLIYRAYSKVRILRAESPDDIVPVICEKVERVTYSKVPDLSGLPPEERKRKFIDLILPSILIANEEVRYIRKSLLGIYFKVQKGIPLTSREREFLSSILKRCRSKSPEEVLVKAFPVPPSMMIAQSAIETGWGTSRFFIEGNNLFGMWTFREKGRVIRARDSEASLRIYPTILESVRGYLYTLNVGWAFEGFRSQRLQSLNPFHLSNFMGFYSVERDEYVRKIKRIIRENNLTRFDSCSLSDNITR